MSSGRIDLNVTTLGQLLDDPEARAVIDEVAPEVSGHPMIGLARGMTFNMLVGLVGSQVPAEAVETLRERLSAL